VEWCSRAERAEIIALDCWRRATDAGEPVTRAVVARRLKQLAAHRSNLPVRALRMLHSGQQRSATLRVDDVWRIVRSWERWTAASPGSGRIRAY
jgi:hypothetical protein